MQTAISVPLWVLLFCGSLFSQSTAPANQPQTFHVKGTIKDPLEGVIPGVKVTFQNEQLTTMVTTNNVGVYEADLSLGDYTMTAQGPRGFRFYHRPLFRVTSPVNAVMNATLLVGPACGDRLIIRGTQVTAEQEIISTDDCEHEDLVQVPSGNGMPFQLSILYGSRTQWAALIYSYIGEKTPQYAAPVFMAYNLFSLQADRVTYDVEMQTIEASGHVVATDESGTTSRANSMAFKIENGQVLLFRPLTNK